MAFGLFLTLLGGGLVGVYLDTVSIHGYQKFSSQHCIMTRQSAALGGVPCTGEKREAGWPVVSSVTYHDLKSTNGTYLPPTGYVCLHGCNMYGPRLTYNTYIVFGVIFVMYMAFKTVQNNQLNKRLRELEYAEKHKWYPPAGPRK